MGLLDYTEFTVYTAVSDGLLRNAATLLDTVLDSSDEVLKAWCGEPLVEAICEAVQQTR